MAHSPAQGTRQGACMLHASPAMSPLQIMRSALLLLADPKGGLAKGVAMSRPSPDSLAGATAAATPLLLSPQPPYTAPLLPSATLAGTGPTTQTGTGQLAGGMRAQLGAGSRQGRGQAAAPASMAAEALRLAQQAEALKEAVLAALPGGGLPSLHQFRRGTAALLVDPSGRLNLAANLSSSAWAQVQAAARASLSTLDSPSLGPEAAFRATFLAASASRLTAFDYNWTVAVARGAPEPLAVCGDTTYWRQQEGAVEALVGRALGDRAGLVRVRRRLVAPQPLACLRGGLPRVEGQAWVQVAARVEPTRALRLVDIGPAADDAPAAARFRAFWGEASELRRFQDGKISEAVVWPVGPGSRHTIPDKIVSYAVARHKPGSGSGLVVGCAGVFDPVLWEATHDAAHHNRSRREADSAEDLLRALSKQAAQRAKKARKQNGNVNESGQVNGGPGSAAFGLAASGNDAAVAAARQLEAATDRLSKQLRGLEELVLKVVGVQPLSAAARGTDPFPPTPHPLAGGPQPDLGGDPEAALKLPRCMEPQKLLVQLENSGRWPAQPEAFTKMKAALGLQLAAALGKSCGIKAQVSEECVDVFSEGFAFRLLLYSGRDEAMLQRSAASAAPQALPLHPPAAAAAAGEGGGALQSPESRALLHSWHHGLVAAVAAANPSFGPAARLAKRWVGSQLMSNHLGGEAVEMLTAAAYVTPQVTPPPGSRLAGFLRFLHLLAHHPWSTSPLVIDPDRQLGVEEVREVQRRADARRAAAGGVGTPALAIATPRDLDGRHWTQDAPQPAALQQLVATARRSLATASCLLPLAPLNGSPQAPHPTPPPTSAVPRAQAEAQGGAATASPPAEEPDQALSLTPDQAAQLAEEQGAAACQAVFSPPWAQGLADLRLCLRPEALPQAQRTLPSSCSPYHPPDDLDARTVALGGAQGLGEARGGAGGGEVAGQPDALWAVLEEWGGRGRPPPPAKRARAFCSVFPEKALSGRGPEALRSELLVGFDPLPLLCSALDACLHGTSLPPPPSSSAPPPAATPAAAPRPPTLATLCVDGLGGQLLGLKWAATAFLPQPLQPATCHAALPCPLSGLWSAGSHSAAPRQNGKHAGGPGSQVVSNGQEERAKGVGSSRGREGGGQLLAVPNVVQLLREVAAIGEGIVEDVVAAPASCSKLPRAPAQPAVAL
ncbi:Nrap protein-domain-containing protein [Haematococcus lacustris]